MKSKNITLRVNSELYEQYSEKIEVIFEQDG